jgi:acetolactate synthase-1/2/3 large subunit
MKLCDAIVKALKEVGVNKVFGVSGANIEHVHDAILKVGDASIESILAKSETGAAFMADGLARCHKKLGVILATSGGGMTNLVSGIAESFQEGIGVLAIIGQPARLGHGKGAFQDASGIGHTINATLLWQSVAKFVAVIDSSEKFWPSLIEALKNAMEGRQGPSVLLIPRDLFDEEVQDIATDFRERISDSKRPLKALSGDLKYCYDALKKSRSPAFIFGLGIKISPWQEAAIRLAKNLNVPVFTSLSSKCAFPNDSAQYFGTLGVAGHPSAHDYINDRADLVISLGTTHPLMLRGPIEHGLTKNLIAVDLDTEAIERALPKTRAIRAEPGYFCQQIEQMIWDKTISPWPLPSYTRSLVRPLVVSDKKTLAKQSSLLRQSEAIAVISRYLYSFSHLLFDAGNCAAAALHYLDIPKNATATIALGMGGMGYAIGAAIGAQVGSPEPAKSIAFVGDGAFLMSGLEIHTAVDLNLPILFIVFNNNKHGMCVTRQKLFFGGRIASTTYKEVHIAQAASGLGNGESLFVREALRREELEDALSAYLSCRPMPGVIELKIDIEEMPPFTPFAKERPKEIALENSVAQTILKVIDSDNREKVHENK